MSLTNHLWRLESRPEEALRVDNFRWCEEPVRDPDDGEVVVRTIYLSLDPTNRLWASDMDQYMPPVAIGEVMRGVNLGVVERSCNVMLPEGTIVWGMWGWQSFHVSRGRDLNVVTLLPAVPLSAYLSVLGISGMSAYFGLFDVGELKRSDTVVISAAAGSVGSIAGQIARLEGCRTIGLAGTDTKCAWLESSLGFDKAVNYRSEGWRTRLTDACPNGVDLYFDNVGGVVSDGVLERMNTHGRVVVCGLISQYNKPEPWRGPTNYGLVLMRCLRIQGFLISNYFGSFAEGTQALGTWLSEGRIKYEVDIVDSLRQAPSIFARLFDGSNRGKLLIRCSAEPARVRAIPLRARDRSGPATTPE